MRLSSGSRIEEGCLRNRVLIIDAVGCWHYVHEDAIADIVFPEGHHGRCAWVHVAGRVLAIEVLRDMVPQLARWAAERSHDGTTMRRD
mgnify:CR=1 FL=1